MTLIFPHSATSYLRTSVQHISQNLQTKNKKDMEISFTAYWYKGKNLPKV